MLAVGVEGEVERFDDALRRAAFERLRARGAGGGLAPRLASTHPTGETVAMKGVAARTSGHVAEIGEHFDTNGASRETSHDSFFKNANDQEAL